MLFFVVFIFSECWTVNSSTTKLQQWSKLD